MNRQQELHVEHDATSVDQKLKATMTEDPDVSSDDGKEIDTMPRRVLRSASAHARLSE